MINATKLSDNLCYIMSQLKNFRLNFRSLIKKINNSDIALAAVLQRARNSS